MVSALGLVKDLDAGRSSQKQRIQLSEEEMRVEPYWDPTCHEDDNGNLNVAAAASIAVAGWCLTGNRNLRQGLLKRLRHLPGQKAKALVEEALLTRGEGAAHDAAVHRLRDAVEGALLTDARAGRLALA